MDFRELEVKLRLSDFWILGNDQTYPRAKCRRVELTA